ncbi:hypothetical protein [Chelativorans xinjiangense]|nr:hypothetical protein [Chelativorans xinjiangense]
MGDADFEAISFLNSFIKLPHKQEALCSTAEQNATNSTVGKPGKYG